MEKEELEIELEEQKENLLNLYLHELIKKQDQTLLTEEHIKSLDDKYPLNQEEREKILMLSHRHILRAEQYHRQEKWDSAIVEMERALLFTPLDPGLRLDLAELYILRSRQYGYLGKDLSRASAKIRETLTLHPGFKKALKMQNELQGLNRMLRGRIQNKKIIPVIIALVLILAAILYPRIRTFRFWKNPDQTEVSSTNTPMETDWTSRDLTVLQTDSLKDKIRLNINEAEIQKNEDSYAISLSGYAQTKKAAVKELTLQLSIGDLLAPALTKEISLLDPSSSELYPDETLPFSAYFKMDSYNTGMDAITLQLSSLKEADQPSDPSQWDSLTPFWEIPRLDDLNLSFSSRKYPPLEGYDRMYLYQDIKIKNNSMDGISALQMTAKWYDSEEKEIASKEIDVIPPGYPPVRRESTQSIRVHLNLPKSAHPVPASFMLSINQIIKEKENVPEESQIR